MHLIAILAAGQSLRFGTQDKLSADINGVPMLRRVCDIALQAGGDDVAVFLSRPQLAASVPTGASVHFVEEGQPFSTRLHAVATYADFVGAHSVTLVLGDMPYMQAAHLRQLRHMCPEHGGARTVLHGAPNTYSGVPVCLKGDQVDLLRHAQNDRGLADLWPRVARSVDLSAPSEMLRDIDRVSDIKAG
jgi:CTP:molybdopterin cytidylyltransferase MocA